MIYFSQGLCYDDFDKFRFLEFNKLEFEKVSEWDTTIQDTMEEYDNVER